MDSLNDLNHTKHLDDTIQVYRALAIIAVVIIHTIPMGEWQVYCRPFVNFAVAMFLFLSGYLTHEKKEWAPLYRRRISRVMIPYLIWSTVYCLPKLVTGQFLGFLFQLGTGDAAYPFYYIFVYVQFVLFTPLIIRLAKSRYCFLGWCVTPIFIVCSIYVPRLTHCSLNIWQSIICKDICLGWFCFYYLGLVLGNKGFGNNHNPVFKIIKNTSLLALVVLYILSLVFQMMEINYWLNFGIQNCGSQLNLTAIVSSVLFCAIAFRLLGKNFRIMHSRILTIIGDYSFGIYLSHVFVIIKLSRYIGLYNNLPYLVNSVVVLIVSFALCYVLSKLLGRKYSHLMGV